MTSSWYMLLITIFKHCIYSSQYNYLIEGKIHLAFLKKFYYNNKWNDFLFQKSQNRQGNKIIYLIERETHALKIYIVFFTAVRLHLMSLMSKSGLNNLPTSLNIFSVGVSWEITKELQLLCIFLINKSHILGNKNTQPYANTWEPSHQKIVNNIRDDQSAHTSGSFHYSVPKYTPFIYYF